MSTLPCAPIGLGRRPALLVIDATTGFTDPASPLGCDASAALAQIARLLAVFRSLGHPVFFTANAYAHAGEASVFREKLPVLNHLGVQGPWAAIDARVSPTPSERVLRKTVPSAFFDTSLRQELAALGVDSAVLCGFSTSGCVRASAVDALQCNLRVVVAQDACGDRDALAHDYNLRDLALKTGDVLDTDAVLALLTPPKETPHA